MVGKREKKKMLKEKKKTETEREKKITKTCITLDTFRLITRNLISYTSTDQGKIINLFSLFYCIF